jgi:hypothetical protein
MAESVRIIDSLLQELSAELDLHYSDVELSRLGPTFTRIGHATVFLQDQGREIPRIVNHILERFRKTHH